MEKMSSPSLMTFASLRSPPLPLTHLAYFDHRVACVALLPCKSASVSSGSSSSSSNGGSSNLQQPRLRRKVPGRRVPAGIRLSSRLVRTSSRSTSFFRPLQMALLLWSAVLPTSERSRRCQHGTPPQLLTVTARKGTSSKHPGGASKNKAP